MVAPKLVAAALDVYADILDTADSFLDAFDKWRKTDEYKALVAEDVAEVEKAAKDIAGDEYVPPVPPKKERKEKGESPEKRQASRAKRIERDKGYKESLDYFTQEYDQGRRAARIPAAKLVNYGKAVLVPVSIVIGVRDVLPYE
jgi:hypothetical protein